MFRLLQGIISDSSDTRPSGLATDARPIVRHTLRLLRSPLRGLLWCLVPLYWLGWWLKQRRFPAAASVGQPPVAAVRENVRQTGCEPSATPAQKSAYEYIAERPVISIGNLTTGGTGKTPLVIWLAEYLQSRQLQPMILSRGYAALPPTNHQGPAATRQTCDSGTGPPQRVNDEFRELSLRLPGVLHWQGPRRAQLARQADQSANADVYLLDDGFQHRYLARQLDIVLVDCSRPFGWGYLLPRGLLREPLNQLARAHAIVLTRSELVPPDRLAEIENEIRRWAGDQIPIARSRFVLGSLAEFVDGQLQPGDATLNTLAGRALAFAGIGNCEGFFKSLQRESGADLHVVQQLAFADHHHYSLRDWQQLSESARQLRCDFLLCTHKDLVKLVELPGVAVDGLRLLAVLGQLEFDRGQSELSALVDVVTPQR